MKKSLLILALCLALGGCEQQTPEQEAQALADFEAQAINDCIPFMVAKSPDGVALWSVSCPQTNYRAVYFSSSGTEYTETHRNGKHHTTVSYMVPNTEAER